jgi:hypothetical protein
VPDAGAGNTVPGSCPHSGGAGENGAVIGLPAAGVPLAAAVAGGQPTGAAYDIVLILHVLCALTGLVTTAVSAVQATWLAGLLGAAPAGGPPGPIPATLRNYYVPGPHVAGRVLYGVPVFGGLLLAMSRGSFGLADAWVEAGFALWIGAITVCELVVWPGENELGARLGPAGSQVDPPAPAPPPSGPHEPGHGGPVRTAATISAHVRGASWVVVALLVVATGFMVGQP